MPRQRKYVVSISRLALQDACDAMSEHVAELHLRAREGERGRGEPGWTRQYADRMAASREEVHALLEKIPGDPADAGEPGPPNRPRVVK